MLLHGWNYRIASICHLPEDICIFHLSQFGSLIIVLKFDVSDPSFSVGQRWLNRFVNLMGGQIWIESEGPDKGCIATFVVKLGICSNPNDPLALQVAARGHLSESAEFIGNKQMFKDNNMINSTFQCYERNFWSPYYSSCGCCLNCYHLVVTSDKINPKIKQFCCKAAREVSGRSRT